ncbi:MAG TPA: hypothetical protein VGK24_17835 [Candidatus Angelobacter sp.]
MRRLSVVFIFWFVGKFLRRLEARLTKCALELQGKGGQAFYISLVQLAIKASTSYQAALLLLRAKLYEESEASQRIFMECWVYLMDFTWNPQMAAVEWWQNPTRPLNEKKFQVKQRVEGQFTVKLKLNSRQKLSLTKLFDYLSNTAVHPTRDAAESAWKSAAERNQIPYGGSDANGIQNLRLLRQTMDNFRIIMHLAWFMRFLRAYLFALEPLKEYFPKPNILERWLESWSNKAPEMLQTLFNQMEMQYAHDKRQERTARNASTK